MIVDDKPLSSDEPSSVPLRYQLTAKELRKESAARLKKYREKMPDRD